ICHREKILVFGDYDVDGITATTLLHEFLIVCGARVSFYIPHRVDEGYGLKTMHINQVAAKNHIDLIVTVDCGSGSAAAITEANRLGIDVIITDHHTISDPPPPACAVVNPQRCDCPAGTDCLAGVGVAFMLLICLRKHLREIDYWKDREEPNLKALCDLVALGTIADIVPLVNENRALTKIGLEVINTAPRPGIQALIEVSGLGNNPVSAEDVAFRIAPRLNAAGRMDHANLAVNLLRAEDHDTARKHAESIHGLNAQRQIIENQVFNRICMYIDQKPELLSRKSMVLASDDWHEGILGIVASRLARMYWRPVALLSFKDGLGKGSARSIPAIDLYQAISECQTCLDKFGGHPMAAGLSLKSERLDEFREAFEIAVSGMATPEAFEPCVYIDYPLPLDRISEQLINELERLQPFGPQNEEPLFCAKDIAVVNARPVGQGHQRLVLKQPAAKPHKPIDGIWFNVPTEYQDVRRFSQLIFKLKWNYWNGDRRMQMIIEQASVG
ncbi:MAG TPA: single-stranded-DNA-specific exonuclease RecJ, partial [Desulfosalsimonadaceae bacterium]|nr:single-stranded-DNA-specific exonuclease RecJ [Desulfosalsimonadaceae bacterium]